MTNEHTETCIYEKGRFELRETDNAIIDLKSDFPPIMIASNTVDDGSEPNYADRSGVLHLLNELADNNPNEEKHWYLKKMLDKSWENDKLKQENERLSRLNESKREQIKFHVDGYNQLKEVNKHAEETIKKQHELIKQLSQENCKIHQIIREAVNMERTELGQTILKNLAENIGVKY